MTPEHKFVVDDAVLGFFNGRTHREREELLRVWRGLADYPYRRANGSNGLLPAASCKSSVVDAGSSGIGSMSLCWRCESWTSRRSCRDQAFVKAWRIQFRKIGKDVGRNAHGLFSITMLLEYDTN